MNPMPQQMPMQPQQAPMPQGMQQPMPQGLPPNMQAFMQMLQAQGYSPQPNLQGAPQQPMPQGGMQGQQAPLPQPMQPNAAGGQQPIQPPMMQPQQVGGAPAQSQIGRHYTPQELSAMGRLGDNAVAHLTQGEVTVPPQVQSPKVLATINKEMKKKGVDISQFTVGSPNVSHNPQTGLPEQSFWSALLPVLGGVAGSFIAPGIGTAIGSGLGGVAGGLSSGQSLTQSLGEGALGAAGSLGGQYAGSLLDGSGGASSDAVNSAQASGNLNQSGNGVLAYDQLTGQTPLPNSIGASQAALPSLTGSADPAVAANQSHFWNAINSQNPGYGQQIGGAIGSGLGSQLGSQIFSPASSGQLPAGFNKPYTTPGQNPSAQTQLGYNVTKQPQANFAGFNPATNFSNAYNFFPTATNGA